MPRVNVRSATVSGLAVAAIGAGSIFIYAGLRGRTVLGTVQALVQGKNPSDLSAPNGGITAGGLAAQAAAAATATGAGAVGGAAGTAVSGGMGAAIAARALTYVGTGYVYGGAPGAHNGLPEDTNRKDCSSFANWVIGHDMGLAIPLYGPGKYTGADHGPPTGAWLLWGGAVTIGHDASVAQPGDLCVWQTHMGIAIGGGQMVSARSASSKPPTGQGAIATGGPAGQLLFVRRLTAIGTAEASANGSQE